MVWYFSFLYLWNITDIQDEIFVSPKDNVVEYYEDVFFVSFLALLIHMLQIALSYRVYIFTNFFVYVVALSFHAVFKNNVKKTDKYFKQKS